MSAAVNYAEQALLAAHEYAVRYGVNPGLLMNSETYLSISDDAQLAEAAAFKHGILFSMPILINDDLPTGVVYTLPEFIVHHIQAGILTRDEFQAAIDQPVIVEKAIDLRPTAAEKQEPRDIIDEIDQLVDEQLQPGPRRGGDYGQENCPHCNQPWHGLPVTAEMKRLQLLPWQKREEALLDYSYKHDTSEVICPGGARLA